MKGSGLSIFTVLGLIFIVLKLIGVIGWSWWLVTLPFWGGLALALAVIAIVGFFGLLAVLATGK